MTATAKIAPSLPKASWWRENWKPLLVVLLVGLIPFLPTLFAGDILFASDQMGSPAWKWYFDGLRRGEIPMWNPYFVGGMPSLDANAGSALYIPTIILGFFLPVTHFITVDFILHTLVAGVCAYVLARNTFRLNPWIAVALATAYMLNTNFISLIFGGHDGKFHILAWMPLALHFLLGALSPRATWKHLIGFAVSVAVFITTSHLQFTYYVLWGFFLVWLYYAVPAVRAKRFKESLSVSARYWIPLLLGTGLIFFMVYPPYQYNKQFSIRGAGERMTYEHATSWSMHPEETASLIVPEFGGINENYWGRNYFKLNSEYPGLVVWFLGLLGLFAFRKSWFWLWGGVGLGAILYGLGADTPFFRPFYEFVPGVKNFRAPSMMLLWLAAALLLMSAETLRRLTEVGPGAVPDAQRAHILKKLRIVGFSVAGVLALVGLAPDIAYSIWNGVFDPSKIPNLARQEVGRSAFAFGALRAAVLTGVLTWAVGAFLLKARRPATFGLIALAVVVVDLYSVNSNFIQRLPASRLLSRDPAIDYLKSDTTKFRVFGMPGVFEGGINNQYYAIETIDGRADHEMRHYRHLRGTDYQSNPNLVSGLVQAADGTLSGNRLLDMLNVKYIAFRVPNDPGIKLAYNKSFLPRAWFVSHWEAVDDSAAYRGILAADFDPRGVAYVSTPGAVSGGVPPDSGTAPVDATIKTMRYNRQAYNVNAPTAGVLVVSDLWFPHWEVRVDGKPAPLLRTNFAFRGVRIEAGAHEVEFRYHSPWLLRGLQVSLLSLVGLVLFAWFARRGLGKPETGGTA
jgi:hypothetical protein